MRNRLGFVWKIFIINMRETEREEREEREEVSRVHIVHLGREEVVERGHLNMVFSVTNRLRFVGKIFRLDVRGIEEEEREEISGVHIVHQRREEVVERGRLNLVSGVERGVRGREGTLVDTVTKILPHFTWGLQLQYQGSLLVLQLGVQGVEDNPLVYLNNCLRSPPSRGHIGPVLHLTQAGLMF